MGVESGQEVRPHPEEEDEAKPQEHEHPVERLLGPGAHKGQEGASRQGHHDGGYWRDEPGAVGGLEGKAHAGEDQIAEKEAQEEDQG
ncbi:hypothetical protein TNMX_05425 [Thermus sp. NMX2.A1]|nr:hypothetical protein TNMX_05425 [Thermus sp. NMX2.A1]